MGITRTNVSTGLAAGLFTTTQQRLLRALFGQPDRSFYATELIGLTGSGSGAVQRELARLLGARLVTVTPVGNQKHYQANRDAPIFEELRGIVRKTFGLADVLRDGLAPLASRIRVAFVFGSVAKGSDRADSDVDLMVVGDEVSYVDLYPLIESFEPVLGRRVNPVVMSDTDFNRKRREESGFVTRVVDQPKLFVVGGQRELDSIGKPRANRGAQVGAAGPEGARRTAVRRKGATG